MGLKKRKATKTTKTTKAAKTTKTTKAAKTTKTTKAAKAPKKGKASGARIRQLLIAGKLDTKGILEIIHGEYSDSKAVGSDVSWNRWMLKSYPEKYDAKTGDSLRAR